MEIRNITFEPSHTQQPYNTGDTFCQNLERFSRVLTRAKVPSKDLNVAFMCRNEQLYR